MIDPQHKSIAIQLIAAFSRWWLTVVQKSSAYSSEIRKYPSTSFGSNVCPVSIWNIPSSRKTPAMYPSEQNLDAFSSSGLSFGACPTRVLNAISLMRAKITKFMLVQRASPLQFGAIPFQREPVILINKDSAVISSYTMNNSVVKRGPYQVCFPIAEFSLVGREHYA